MRGQVGPLALALLLLPVLSPAGEKVWYEYYEQGLSLLEEGRPAEAAEALKEALAVRPKPGVRVRTYGVRYVDYLPHLYLGICAVEMGKKELAQEYFDLSERHGAVKDSEEGLALLKQYRLRLAHADVLARPATAPSTGLAEEEYRRVEGEVMDRCRIDRRGSPRFYPWYFHYELGLELLKREDPSRALTSFLDALDKKEKPAPFSRTYGMWYVNYAPYYHIGLAHYRLGNYDCAADAFELSASLKELPRSEPNFREREKLRGESKKKMEPR